MVLRLLLIASLGLAITGRTLGQSTDIRMYIFGHSLIDHRPPLNPTPSDETTVPHWLALFAQSASNGYAATGQFGLLTNHINNLPPSPQFGYDIVSPITWEENESISDANINTVLMTARNFGQYLPPDVNFEDGSSQSAVSATTILLDYLTNNVGNPRTYIYENWPEMSSFTNGNFPPSASQFSDYNDYTVGDFHQWWLDYQDFMLAARPEVNIRMIPVGPAIVDLFANTSLGEVSAAELYEDADPHGQPTIYFLAAMVTYMAIYETPTPAEFSVPEIVHPNVHNAYVAIRDRIWTYLNAFNDDAGNSRVFFDGTTSTTSLASTNTLNVGPPYPNPSPGGKFSISYQSTTPANYTISLRNLQGKLSYQQKLHLPAGTGTLSFQDQAPPGAYLLTIYGHQHVLTKKLIISP